MRLLGRDGDVLRMRSDGHKLRARGMLRTVGVNRIRLCGDQKVARAGKANDPTTTREEVILGCTRQRQGEVMTSGIC